MLVPAGILAFAAMGKLKSAYVAFYLHHLNASELVCNVVLPIVEFVMALGLVVCFSRTVLPACIAFAVYVGYLIQVKVSGSASCNCLGGYEQDVRLIMALDFVCLGVLLICNRSQKGRLAFLFPATIVLAIPISTVFWISNPGVSSLVAESFSPSPIRSDHRSGTRVVSNSSFQSEVNVTNRSRKKLQMKRILASCDCTILTPDSLTLDPGESKSLQVTIDLNKSYTPGLSSLRHHITASCYDDKDDLIGQITLFKGESIRTFSVEAGLWVHQWLQESVNDVEIPIAWISKSNSPVECSIDGKIVATASFPNPLRIHVERPKSYFEKRRLILSRTENSERMVLELDLSIVFKPDDVTVDFRSIENSFELDTKDGFEIVDVRICDWDGKLVDRAAITSDENNQNGKVQVRETKGPGSCYFDLTVCGVASPSHRIIIPFNAEGNQP